MKTPQRLAGLLEEGLIDEVIGQLMSGKEATVYVVRCGDAIRCAKVYKDATQRSFKKSASYQEGRKVKNSRQARAMEKGSRYGRKMQEEVWQNAEVDALYRLASAGVRVPRPHICFEGVLLMDLVVDAEGNPAPRLNDVQLDEELAMEFHGMLINQVVRMLCAGIVHGDLSEYNVLVGDSGPVIIDLPQAIDAAANSTAAEMLERDVNNLRTYFSSFAPALRDSQFGKEIWGLYEGGSLTPEQVLTGHVVLDEHHADVDAVLMEVELAIKENEFRQMCRLAAKVA
jgi:RIO kinase 1